MAHEIESNDAAMCLEEPAGFHGGSVALVGTCEGLRRKTVHPSLFAPRLVRSEYLAADVLPDIRDGVAHCK